MSTLYKLTSELTELQHEIEEALEDGQDLGQLQTRVDQLLGNLDDTHSQWLEKIDGTLAIVQAKSDRVKNIQAEIDRLSAWRDREQKTIDWLRSNIQWAMVARGARKIETSHFKLTIVRNGGKQGLQLIVPLEPEELPEKFQKVSIGLDSEALRSALEKNDPIATAIAQLKPRGEHLRIR